MIALNVSGFALMLQLDMLIFHDVIAKVVAWVVTAGAWALVYVYRNK